MAYLLESLTIAFLNQEKKIGIHCLKKYIFKINDEMDEEKWDNILKNIM